MSLNAFTTFLDECEIADHESQFVKRSDCDTVFIVCNFQPDKKSAEAQVNLENAMMRYEFIEAIVRLGKARVSNSYLGCVHNIVSISISRGTLPKDWCYPVGIMDKTKKQGCGIATHLMQMQLRSHAVHYIKS